MQNDNLKEKQIKQMIKDSLDDAYEKAMEAVV
jgi:hypothetical protein